MPKLTVLVGPPGSGKSTLAKKIIDHTPDDIDRPQPVYINQDSQGRDGHMALFQEALANGKDIIVDRMGFDRNQRNRYIFPASGRGYDTRIIVLHQPYRVCLERALARTEHETIKDEKAARSALSTFFSKYERPEQGEAGEIEFRYPEGDKPSAIICDLDGTLCNVDHRLHTVRPPKEWAEEIALAKSEKRPNVHGWKANWPAFFDGIPGDGVNQWCQDILFSMQEKGHKIVFCSGRPDNHKRATKDWLCNKTGYYNPILFMRPRGDSRDDSIVKEIILDFEILTRFTPYFMIDDRKRVFEMWRKRGFTCLACANGDF
jgi:predicted kinase